MSDPSIHAREQRIVEVAGRWWREHQAGLGLTEESLLAMHPELQPELALRVHFLKRLRDDRSAIHLTPRRHESRRRATSAPASPRTSPVSPWALPIGSHSVPSPSDDWRSIDFTPGTEIAGRYTVGCLLGDGGLGVVYRAYDQVLQKPVALKFFRSNLNTDRHQLVQREVALSQRVSHVNVCRVHDLNIEHDPRFLSMEYIDGEDLDRTLQRVGRILDERALQIATEISAGLAAAHRMGVLHRDLKPQNIMIDGAGVARITDFGLGSLVHAHEESDLHGGTFRYMAPEVIRGEEATTKSDLFALGIVLYELYTGRHPLDSDNDTLPSDWNSFPMPSELVPQIDPSIERTIQSCLEVAPELRPSSADDVGRMLLGEAVRDRAIRVHRPDADSLKRLRWLAIATVVAIFAAWWAAPHFRLLEQVTVSMDHLSAYRETAIAILNSQSQHIQHNEGLVATGMAYDAPFVNDRRATNQTISYWYRQSDQPLRPQRFILSRDQHTIRTSFEDPAWNRPAMVGVKIGLDGKLVEYRAFATSTASSTPPPAPTSTSPADTSNLATDEASLAALFDYAKLKLSQYEPHPETPPAAWTPVLNALGPSLVYRPREAFRRTVEPEVHVVRAGHSIVSFRVEQPGRQPIAQSPINGKKWHNLMHMGFMASGVLGCLLARRNSARLMADRRVASRSAWTVFFIAWTGWYFTASHTVFFEAEYQLIQFGVANAIFWAATQWLLYMSLEPFLRKGNPHSLTTWTRLFHGHWRDPLVARDLLLGSLVGASLIPVLGTLHHVGRAALGWPGRFEIPPLELLAISSPSGVAALVANAIVNSIYSALLLLFLHRLCCRVLGHSLAGTLFAWCVLTWFMGCRYDAGVNPWTDYLAWFGFMSLWAGAFLFVTCRWGLLSSVAMLAFFQSLLYTPGTLQWNRWYATTGLITAFLLALAVSGYLLSVALPNRSTAT